MKRFFLLVPLLAGLLIVTACDRNGKGRPGTEVNRAVSEQVKDPQSPESFGKGSHDDAVTGTATPSPTP